MCIVTIINHLQFKTAFVSFICFSCSIRRTECSSLPSNCFALDFSNKVCSEETINEILQRYLMYNQHAASYTWKYDGVELDMDKTLDGNGITDEDEQFYELRMNDNEYLQAVHIYYNDDLTEA